MGDIFTACRQALLAAMLLLSFAPAARAAESTCPGTGFSSCAQRMKYAKARAADHEYSRLVAEAQIFDDRISCPEHLAWTGGIDYTDNWYECKSEEGLPQANYEAIACFTRGILERDSDLHKAPPGWSVLNQGLVGRGTVILSAASEAMSRVGILGESDRRTIDDLYEECGIPLSISVQQLDEAVTKFADHVIEANSVLRKSNPNGAKAMNLEENVVKNMVREARYFPDILNMEGKPKPSGADIYQTLRGIEESQPRFTPLFKSRKSISPYQARMIRMYLAEKECHKRKPALAQSLLDQTARKLRLKLNVAEPAQATWASIIPHDGYLMGATQQQVETLLSDNASPDASAGVDCSSLVDYTIHRDEGTRKRLKRGRTWTGGLLKNLPDTYDRKRVCSEKELEPGDVLVYSGEHSHHAYIFAGFEERPPYRAIIFEATGGAQRDVGYHKIDFYEGDGTCQKSWLTRTETYRRRLGEPTGAPGVAGK
ncbi:MAG: C40 family peptidase [Deltaproteobacteria bacterium]|nr:C40 family peptidase [Deltaproteobacteria bacterium]